MKNCENSQPRILGLSNQTMRRIRKSLQLYQVHSYTNLHVEIITTQIGQRKSKITDGCLAARDTTIDALESSGTQSGGQRLPPKILEKDNYSTHRPVLARVHEVSFAKRRRHPDKYSPLYQRIELILM